MKFDMRFAASIVFASCALAACERGMRDMYDQDRPHPDAGAARFPDGRDPRPQPPDTVAHSVGIIASTSSGRMSPASESPAARQRLEYGRNRYDIYCAPCHSAIGGGDGMIVRRGFPKPESLHTPKSRALSDADIDTAIANGYGAMKPMGGRLDQTDRAAIIDYIRALQLSQNAKLDDVPADKRQALEGGVR